MKGRNDAYNRREFLLNRSCMSHHAPIFELEENRIYSMNNYRTHYNDKQEKLDKTWTKKWVITTQIGVGDPTRNWYR